MPTTYPLGMIQNLSNIPGIAPNADTFDNAFQDIINKHLAILQAKIRADIEKAQAEVAEASPMKLEPGTIWAFINSPKPEPTPACEAATVAPEETACCSGFSAKISEPVSESAAPVLPSSYMEPQHPVSDMQEYSLEGEEWRCYQFPILDSTGDIRCFVEEVIQDPQRLYFRTNGSTHRILDKNGVVTCVPAPGHCGCVLRWKPRGSQPVNF